MKNYVRIWGVMCCLILCVLFLLACSENKKDTDKSETPETSATVAPEGGEEAAVTPIVTTAVTLSDKTTDIYVAPVEGLSEDFNLGVDISSLISEENSGVVFYNDNGEEQDLLLTLAENGVNSVRLRIWNDPYDANGNSYGGGVCDVDTAIAIGKRATQYGMSVVIDFHYSDFWADPAKQMAPKAWASMSLEDKTTAVYDFTKASLTKILNAGINVSMVQLGNETTNGFCGETSWKSISTLMNSGAKAIRELTTSFKKDMLIVVHFTNPENASKYAKFAQVLRKYAVDYDVFASSYYPFWHGTPENLTAVLSDIAETYDKKVCVAEVSWAYTYENGDDFGNTISEESVVDLPYSISEQGQADCVRDTVAAIAAVGEKGIGVYYWEPAWIPVPGGSYDANLPIWEEFGSGWASSYSAEYDPEDAGEWYGGSSWDNQALFDFDGHPLDSLSIFRLLKSGSVVEAKIDAISDITAACRLEDVVKLPETIVARYNDRSEKELAVTWNETQISAIDTTVLGSYVVDGTVSADGTDYTIHCTVSVVEKNYLDNAGFEDDDTSMWNFINIDDKTTELYVVDKVSDAANGNRSVHFYSGGADGVEFKLEQTVNNITAGTYHYSMTIHGGDCGDFDMYIYAIVDGKTYTQETSVSDWREFQYPELTGLVSTDGTITVGVYVKAAQGGWGNIDDFVLAPEE